MAAGKTSTGKAANSGQIKWANAQLKKLPAESTPRANTSQSVGGNVGMSVGTAISNPIVTPTYARSSSKPAISTVLNSGASNVSQNPYNSTPSNPYQFTAYQPFEYTKENIEANPVYQAALKTAEGNIQTGQNNTLANLIANGQGNSSYAATVSQQIANKEMANLSNNLLPTMIEQAYNRHVDSFNMNNQVESQNYGVGRDLVNDTYREWELTGQGMSPEARGIIGQILAEKEKYKAATDQAGREQANSNANALRSTLASLGYDPSYFDANQTLSQAQANMSKAGKKTLAAQGQEFNQGLANSELTGLLPNGNKTVAEQQRELENQWYLSEQTGVISPYLSKLYGIPEGTRTQSAMQFALEQAVREQNANRPRSGGGSSSGSSPKPVNLNTVINNINDLYTKYSNGERTVTNLDGIKAYIDSMGLSDAQRNQLYAYYGVGSGGGGNDSFWDITKNVLSSLANGSGNKPATPSGTVSDQEINQWLNSGR